MPHGGHNRWEDSGDPTLTSELIDYLHRCGGEGTRAALYDYAEEVLGYSKQGARHAIDGLIDDGVLNVLERGGGRGKSELIGYNYEHPLDGNIPEDQVEFYEDDDGGGGSGANAGYSWGDNEHGD